MRNKKYFLVPVSLLLLTLLLSTSAVSAHAPKSYFTGVEALEAPTGGTTEIVAGKVHLRDVVQLAFDTTNDPRTSGNVTIVINAIWALPDLTGPAWGTFRIENDGGAWYGHYQGHRTLEGDNIISTFQATGHGSGDYEGLVGKWNFTGVNAGPDNPYLEIGGYILEPHGD